MTEERRTTASISRPLSSVIRLLLILTDTIAALLLAADLLVVCGSVLLRFLFNAPVEWSDDVARGLMVGSSFFGAASALERGENAGVVFVVERLPPAARALIDAGAALLVLVISAYVAVNALRLGALTTGQTTGSGLPLELTFYPMGAGAACMSVFALEHFVRRPARDVAAAFLILVLIAAAWFISAAFVPDAL